MKFLCSCSSSSAPGPKATTVTAPKEKLSWPDLVLLRTVKFSIGSCHAAAALGRAPTSSSSFNPGQPLCTDESKTHFAGAVQGLQRGPLSCPPLPPGAAPMHKRAVAAQGQGTSAARACSDSHAISSSGWSKRFRGARAKVHLPVLSLLSDPTHIDISLWASTPGENEGLGFCFNSEAGQVQQVSVEEEAMPRAEKLQSGPGCARQGALQPG